jgi:hypothetical protein
LPSSRITLVLLSVIIFSFLAASFFYVSYQINKTHFDAKLEQEIQKMEAKLYRVSDLGPAALEAKTADELKDIWSLGKPSGIYLPGLKYPVDSGKLHPEIIANQKSWDIYTQRPGEGPLLTTGTMGLTPMELRIQYTEQRMEDIRVYLDSRYSDLKTSLNEQKETTGGQINNLTNMVFSIQMLLWSLVFGGLATLLGAGIRWLFVIQKNKDTNNFYSPKKEAAPNSMPTIKSPPASAE